MGYWLCGGRLTDKIDARRARLHRNHVSTMLTNHARQRYGYGRVENPPTNFRNINLTRPHFTRTHRQIDIDETSDRRHTFAFDQTPNEIRAANYNEVARRIGGNHVFCFLQHKAQ